MRNLITCHVGNIGHHVVIMRLHVGKKEVHVGKKCPDVGNMRFTSENTIISKKPSNRNGCQSYRQHPSRFSTHPEYEKTFEYPER